MHHESICCPKISLKGGLVYFCLIFWLVFVKGPAFRNFGSHYFHDKQLGEFPHLQYPWSVGPTLKNQPDIQFGFSLYGFLLIQAEKKLKDGL
jgi:hypothetical protein